MPTSRVIFKPTKGFPITSNTGSSATYHVGTKIGQGGFGEVWSLNAWSPFSSKYVIKFYFKHKQQKTQDMVTREVEAYHANGVHVIRWYEDGDQRCTAAIVMPKFPGLKLDRLLADAALASRYFGGVNRGFCPKTIRFATAALLRLHMNGFVHGDLTNANMLVTPQGDVTIIDLGTTRKSGTQWRTDEGVTPGYVVPEWLLFSQIKAQYTSDLHQLSTCLIEVVLHISRLTTLEAKKHYASQLSDESRFLDMVALLRWAHNPDPNLRPTIDKFSHYVNIICTSSPGADSYQNNLQKDFPTHQCTSEWDDQSAKKYVRVELSLAKRAIDNENHATVDKVRQAFEMRVAIAREPQQLDLNKAVLFVLSFGLSGSSLHTGLHFALHWKLFKALASGIPSDTTGKQIRNRFGLLPPPTTTQAKPQGTSFTPIAALQWTQLCTQRALCCT